MKNLKQKTATLAVALVLSAASISQAVPTLYVTDGVTTQTIVDDGAFDLFGGTPGIVGYAPAAGTYAGWTFLLNSGTAQPALGGVSNPEMDLTWQVIRGAGAGAGNISFYFSADGYTLTSGRQMVTASSTTLGANTSASVSTYYNSANVNYTGGALPTLLTSQNFSSPGGFDLDSAATPADPNGVAFIIGVTLTQAGINGTPTVSSGDIHLRNVPEGGSMVTFLGTALLALGAFAARRKA